MAAFPSSRWKCPESVVKRTQRSTRVVAVALAFVATYLALDRLRPDLASVGRASFGDSPADDSRDGSAKIRIFYNLFTKGPEDEERVRKIVEEQFAHIDPRLHETNVSIISIGHRISNLPNNSHVVAHHGEGGEELTLRALWNYCRANNDPRARVAYLHSKGSYHPTEANVRLRRFVTRGALSAECAKAVGPSPGRPCDVCSSRMSPLPHPHTSGNMWLARCAYVSHLIDPSALTEGRLPARMNEDDPCRGRGRYLGEHWVHSHPSVRPCDLYKGREFTWAHLRVPVATDWNKDLTPAPRFKFDDYVLPGMCMDDHPETLRIEDYIGLRTENYELLYNVTALEEDWWGWEFLKRSVA